MRTIVFKYNPWRGEHNAKTVEVEVDDNTTEEEINEMWHDWVWEKVADHSTWYEKVDEKANKVSNEAPSDDIQTYLFKAGEKLGRIISKHNDVQYAHAVLTRITRPSVSLEDKLNTIMMLCSRYQAPIPVELTDDNGDEYIRTYIMGITSMYK